MTTTESAVDRQYAQQSLDEVTACLDQLRQEHLASANMVDYHYDKLIAMEVHQQLWSDVVCNDWDQAASQMGDYIRGVTAGLSTTTPRRLVELRAALGWWAANRRRAMREGLDMECLVMAL